MDIEKLKIPVEPLPMKESIKRGPLNTSSIKCTEFNSTSWVAAPLWSDYGWGGELKRNGMTWQIFMGVVRDHYPYFLDWTMGRMSWNEVIEKLKERLVDEAVAMRESKEPPSWQ